MLKNRPTMALLLPLLFLSVLAGCRGDSSPTAAEGLRLETLGLQPMAALVEASTSASFSEDFSGGASAFLQSTGGSSIDYSGGDAQFGTLGDGMRGYLRTLRSDYHQQDFVAEITVTVEDGIAFVGFGAGSPNAGWFFEPATSPAAYVRVMPSNFIGNFEVTTSFSGITEQVGGAVVGGGGNGTHRVRMTSTTCGALTWEIDRNWTGGPFVADHAIGPVAMTGSFNDTNSRIFFGGSDGIRFDDLQVTSVPAGPCVATVSNWSEFKAALDNPLYDEIHLADHIEVPSNASGFGNQYGRLYVGRTVTIRGFGHRLNFAHGELIVGSPGMTSDVVVTLENLELRVWNPTWRIPASAYGILVHRGTLLGERVLIDLRWTDEATQWASGSAAPAGITTHYGVLTQGWTIRAELRNSAIRVFSQSGTPYGAYASAGSTMEITGTHFDISRSDTSALVQGVAIGLQDELPSGFPTTPRIYAEVRAAGNRSNGTVSHGALIYRASGDLDDVGTSAAAILERLLRANQLLPACGLLLPNAEEQCLAKGRGLKRGNGRISWGAGPQIPGF
jgi:hypothetical protein